MMILMMMLFPFLFIQIPETSQDTYEVCDPEHSKLSKSNFNIDTPQ